MMISMWIGQWDIMLVVICVALTLIVLTARGIHWILGDRFVIRPSTERLLILILLAGLGIHTLNEHRTPEAQIVRTVSAAKVFYEESWNPYLETKVSDSMRQLIEVLSKAEMMTHALDTAQRELERAIQATRSGDEVLAIDYGLDWAKTYSEYHAENVKACRTRNVRITRVFIISDVVVRWPDVDRKSLWDKMNEQHEAGCKVFIGKEPNLREALQSNQDYGPLARGLAIFQYGRAGGGVVFLEEDRPYEAAGKPYLLNVKWSKEDVERYISYFRWLSSKQTKIVRDLSDIKQEELFPPATASS